MTLPNIWITFLSDSVNLYTFSHWFLCRFLSKIWSFELFISTGVDTCWTYANEFMTQAPPWVLGSGPSFCTVLAMCACHFRPPYTLCVKIYNISMVIQSLKIMLLCGFHWHSRYSIWISPFVLLHCVWFTGSSCGQQLPSVVICHDNWLISSFINSTTHIHAYFYIFLLVYWCLTSASEMALFGSVNLGHGTDACLHYTLNDIMPQMTQVFIFTFVVQ